MLLRNLSIIFLLLLRLRNHIFPLLPLLLHDNKEVHRDVNRRSDPGCLIGEAGSGEAVYRDDEESHDGTCNHLGQSGEHRRAAVSQSLYAAAENAEDCQQIIEPRKASDLRICIGDTL